MSIYGTIFDLGNDHARRCQRVRRIKTGLYAQDDSKPCSCGASPVIYEGSHVLPSKRSKRGGTISLGAIPSCITRDGRDDAPEGNWWPWLRLSVDGVGEETDTVLLTADQVEQLRNALTCWLDNRRSSWNAEHRIARQKCSALDDNRNRPSYPQV